MRIPKWHIAPRDGEGEPWVYLAVWDGDRYCGTVGSSLHPSLSMQTTARTMASLAHTMNCAPETFVETSRVGGYVPPPQSGGHQMTQLL